MHPIPGGARFAAPGGARFAAHGGARSATIVAAPKGIDDELSFPIILAERVRKAALEADSLKSDCADISKQVDILADMLRSVARLPSPPYDRPIRRVFAAATHTLERALAFVRRCRRSSVLSCVVTITTGSADHRKLQNLLDASIGDLRWLVSLYADSTNGVGFVPGLPPIASTDPILSWVWSYIATLQMAASAASRAEAANSLASLANDSDRNKSFIIEEGGLPPLLALLRDGPSVEARIAAAVALTNLAADGRNVAVIVKEQAVPVTVSVLYDAPMKLQTKVASLVAIMADQEPAAREEFARENACPPLVSLLCFEVPLDDPRTPPSPGPRSVHSLVRGMAAASASPKSTGGIRTGSYYERSHHRKEIENETPEAKLQLKLACSKALWMLTRGGNVSNSRKITETKGLLCLAKIIEREGRDLQYHCLMTIMEIASAAEEDADLRCSAFKNNSAAAKLVVEQLLKLVRLGISGIPALQIPAIRAIGSLSHIFSAKETHVLTPLVAQLEHLHPDVVNESANALIKFACPANHLCAEHSNAIVEFGAVPPLLKLLRTGDKTQLPALTLLCHLAMQTPNSEALVRYKILGTLESVVRSPVAHHPSLRDLLPEALCNLELYSGGGNSHGQMYAHGSLLPY